MLLAPSPPVAESRQAVYRPTLLSPGMLAAGGHTANGLDAPPCAACGRRLRYMYPSRPAVSTRRRTQRGSGGTPRHPDKPGRARYCVPIRWNAQSRCGRSWHAVACPTATTDTDDGWCLDDYYDPGKYKL